jgi:hypothetical protein
MWLLAHRCRNLRHQPPRGASGCFGRPVKAVLRDTLRKPFSMVAGTKPNLRPLGYELGIEGLRVSLNLKSAGQSGSCVPLGARRCTDSRQFRGVLFPNLFPSCGHRRLEVGWLADTERMGTNL